MFSFWLLVLSIGSTLGESAVKLATNITFADQTGICPVRTPVEFLCNGTDVFALKWKKNRTLIRTLTLSDRDSDHEQLADLTATGYDGIRVQLVAATGTEDDRANLTSRLVVKPSALMVGDQISCNDKGNFTYIRKAPPPAAPFVSSISKEAGNSVALTLKWSHSFTETHAVDRYCVVVQALGRAHQSETTCVTSDTSYVSSGLAAGKRYEFEVYGVNCGHQNGPKTSPFVVSPQVPGRPTKCKSVPVYEQSSGKLTALLNTWTAVPNPVEIASGVHQDVLWYSITFKRDDVASGSANITVSEVCTTRECAYGLSTSFSGSYYTISIAAENIAGLGEHLMCTPHHISTTNSVVQVTANTNVPEYATIECLFPTILIPAMCKVCYGIGLNCLNLTCLQPVHPNADGRATVILPEVERKLKYCYLATIVMGSNEVLAVQGSFSTACDEMDLVLQMSPIRLSVVDGIRIDGVLDLRCSSDSVGSLQIPNGVVCYTGTTLGSTAYYICNSDYQLSGHADCQSGCNWRNCRRDGHWDGKTLLCLQPVDVTHTNSGAVVVLSVLLSLGAGVLLIAASIFAFILKHLSDKLKQSQTGHVNVSTPSPQASQPESQLPGYVEYEDMSHIDETDNTTKSQVLVGMNRNDAYNHEQ